MCNGSIINKMLCLYPLHALICRSMQETLYTVHGNIKVTLLTHHTSSYTIHMIHFQSMQRWRKKSLLTAPCDVIWFKREPPWHRNLMISCITFLTNFVFHIVFTMSIGFAMCNTLTLYWSDEEQNVGKYINQGFPSSLFSILVFHTHKYSLCSFLSILAASLLTSHAPLYCLTIVSTGNSSDKYATCKKILLVVQSYECTFSEIL